MTIIDANLNVILMKTEIATKNALNITMRINAKNIAKPCQKGPAKETAGEMNMAIAIKNVLISMMIILVAILVGLMKKEIVIKTVKKMLMETVCLIALKMMMEFANGDA